MSELDSTHYLFARLAVDKAKLCPVDHQAQNPAPRVGIVLARGAELIGWYAKGVGGQFMDMDQLKEFTAKPSAHAEQALLEQMAGVDLSDATAYITLEPCTKKKGKGLCCADLLVQARIRQVYIGNCDPNPDVGGLAWRTFHAAGIEVLDFSPELRNEARRDNDAFFRKFHFSIRDEGAASFDYMSNGGERTLGAPGKAFKTSWTNRGDGSIYALDYKFNVALAKNCTNFEQIDDPARWFEDSHYTKPVSEGQIVIFRNDTGYALVQVLRVGSKTDLANAELHFRYQLRY
jgi:pyrimidine deaminase RibD-like protein